MSNGNEIAKIKARQVLDSKGRPVVEVDVVTRNGLMGRAGASTGTSVGKHESFVLRDGDPSCFGGLSVHKAISNVENRIAPALIGMDATDPVAIDRRMIELDGTRYKTNLGGNAIFACSVAATRAGAACRGEPLYRFLAQEEIRTIFTPAYNMINGGTYEGKTLAFQEFLVIPKGVPTVRDGVRIGVEVFMRLGETIRKRRNGKPPVMGNYSGYAAPSDDPFEIFDMLEETVDSLGYRNQCCFAMDCAASEFYDEKEDCYRLGEKRLSRDELIALLSELARRYPIGFIEDPLQEEDFEGFRVAAEKTGALLVGDDFICSSIDRATRAVEMKAVHGMIFKPNQAGTLTEALETARFMKEKELLVVASGRAGGVLDDPNAELAVAIGAPMMKTGAPRSGERVSFSNAALRMEEELGNTVKMFDVTRLLKFIPPQI